MYLVRANLLEQIEGVFVPLHVVLEERVDALRLSSSLRAALESATQPEDSPYYRSIKGLLKLINTFAGICERPIKRRCPRCGRHQKGRYICI